MIRIGITTSFNEDEQRLHHTYVQAVERAGGLPLIVPMLETREATEDFVDLLDALVITGGPAIGEGTNGALAPELDELDPVREAVDRRLLDAFSRRRRPMLGICYGMQLLNVRAGGTLYGDVEHQQEDATSHSQKRDARRHPLHCEPGTWTARLLGVEPREVNTRHLQAVARVGEGLRVAARAPDGVVEAIESEDGLVLGVQFHPEREGDAMLPLFHHLVERARSNRSLEVTTQ